MAIIGVMVSGGPTLESQQGCLAPVTARPFATPRVDSALVESVKRQVVGWPSSDVISPGGPPLDTAREALIARSANEVGRDRFESALVYIIATKEPGDEIFGGAVGAYMYLNYSTGPLGEVLLSSDASREKRLRLYLMIVMLEDPPPARRQALSGSEQRQARQLGSARITYVCSAAREFENLQGSPDSTDLDAARREAVWLITLLNEEAEWGNSEAAALRKDPVIASATKLLIRDKYLDPRYGPTEFRR